MTIADPREDPLDGESLSTAVVQTLADAEGVDPLELDPLYNTLDPDALDKLFSSTGDSEPQGSVRFTTNGYEVTVTSTGRVHLSEVNVADPA